MAGRPGADGPHRTQREHWLGGEESLRGEGKDPYPPRLLADHTVAQVHDANADLGPDRLTGDWVRLAGRLMLIRRQGGLTFASLQDQTGQIQLFVDTAVLGSAAHHAFNDLNRGDWVGVAGTVMTTRRGVLSIRVSRFQLLTKAIRPLPDQRPGLTDATARYRWRDVDLAVNESTRRIFRIRHAAISAIRRYLTEHGFTEVECPVLQTSLPISLDDSLDDAGARPFRTHHNALNLDLFLRSTPELQLTRLVVGGMQRVFELGRAFRNTDADTEGDVGTWHPPEFTLLETYQAFAGCDDMVNLIEELVTHVAQATLGERHGLPAGGAEIDLTAPWPRLRMAELITKHTGAVMHPAMPLDAARAILDEQRVRYVAGWSPGRLMTQLFEQKVRPEVRGPVLCLDCPREVAPLARAQRDDPGYAEHVELIVAGVGLGNAIGVQNDPAQLRTAFEAQVPATPNGDPVALGIDPDYLRALEYGLPPTGGLRIGIDRLVMLLAGVDSVREVILFPMLRPELPPPLVPPPLVPPPPGAGVGGQELARTPLAVSPGRVPTSPTLPTQSRWPRRVIAGCTAAGGVLQLLAVLPFRSERIGPVELTFGWFWFSVAGRVVSVLIGLLLILLAGQLAKGKRTAWYVAVGLFTVGAAVHLLKGPHLVATSFCLAMVLVLGLTRRWFRAAPDPPSLLELVRFVPIYLAAVLGFGLTSLALERHDLSPPLTWSGGLTTVLGGLVGLAGPYAYQRPLFAAFFPAALLVLGVAGLLIVAGLLFRPLRANRPHTEADWHHARRLVRCYGWDTLAGFALREDKNFFFCSDGEAMLAYTYLGGYALVSGDPIGAPQSIPVLLDEFLALCAERAWNPAFLAIREADFRHYAARGFRSFYLGDEAILRCDTFSLTGLGRAGKSLRAAVRRVGRTHRFVLINESQASPRLVEQLNAISARWRGKAPERGFTMSLSQDVRGAGANPEFLLGIAFDADNVPGGFLRLIPAYGPEFGYTLDLMRHDPDAPNGMTEFLLVHSAQVLRGRGAVRLSMNFAVWGRLFADDIPATQAQRLARWVVGMLTPFFQITSLREFNAKFNPQWLPRVLAYRRPTDLARVGLRYAGAEGFLAIPGIGALLVPKAIGGEGAGSPAVVPSAVVPSSDERGPDGHPQQ